MKERKPQSSWKQDWAPFDTWVKNTVPWRNLPFWGAIFLAARQHFFVKLHVKCANAPSPKGQQTLKYLRWTNENPRKDIQIHENSLGTPRIPLANHSVLYLRLSLQFSRCLSEAEPSMPEPGASPASLRREFFAVKVGLWRSWHKEANTIT